MSEFRQDLVSGDWIISATGRAERPELLIKKKNPRKPAPKKNCPFEDLEKSGNWPPVLTYPASAKSAAGKPNAKNWEIAVIKNKYPAVVHQNKCAVEFFRGPYRLKTGVGEHELLITRDHFRPFADLSRAAALDVFRVFQGRYKTFAEDKCNVYVSAFFNWGASAGASIYHPHYQILALPIVPPHIKASLFGSRRFFRKYRECARCATLKYDGEERKRIIEKNSAAVALAPFVSKKSFEVSVFPRKHFSSFEKTPIDALRGSAEILQSVLRRVKKRLADPDLNFFIHSTPFGGRWDRFHHWHIEIIPQIEVQGGFELSTGVDINIVEPERAAKILSR